MAAPDATRLRGRAVVRDPYEEHRASTPLELFFDLTYVAAVGRAAATLHHQLGEGHVAGGLVGFGTVFFAVWWGWLNYTWFASGHDSDDVTHRLLTLLQSAGVLVFAAGVTRAAEHGDFGVVVLGFSIMRVGLILSWLRVARDQPGVRRRALRFAGALAAVQTSWIAWLWVPDRLMLVTFVVLAVAELCVPVWVERADGQVRFHCGHIEERHGLFAIIVLGESILSATAGFQTEFDDGRVSGGLLAVGTGALVLAFTAWWVYFEHPGHLSPEPATAFRWGYAHVAMFASLAALGAGIHLAAEVVGHTASHASERVASLAVALPMAAYLLGMVLVILLTGARALQVRVWPKVLSAAAMAMIGLTMPVPATVLGCAAVMTALAAWMIVHPPT